MLLKISDPVVKQNPKPVDNLNSVPFQKPSSKRRMIPIPL